MHFPTKTTVAAILGLSALAVSASVQHAASDTSKSKTPPPTSAQSKASTERAASLKARHEKASAHGDESPSKNDDHAAASSARAAHDNASRGKAETVWSELIEGNRRFVAGRPADKSLVETRKSLAAGQHPDAIVLACADSRVSPELIFDAGLGELFVVRVAGNVADPAALGSIEYAIEHLHCGVIVVVGHDKCGAVAAAASGAAMPTPNLDALVRRIEPSLETLRLCAEGEELVHMGVRMNAHGSACALLAESGIVSHAVQSGELTVITAVYELESGIVKRLPVSPCITESAR
ncbi:MAG: carbonic anhydrase [Planctomycetes bacterium]|nr:carbonic anhydrase [Planctomycetota bacterium]